MFFSSAMNIETKCYVYFIVCFILTYASFFFTSCLVFFTMQMQSSISNSIFIALLSLSALNCHYFLKGGAIQGSSKARDVAHFTSAIVEGLYYEVKGLYTSENKSTNIVIDNDVVVELKSNVKTKAIDPLTLAVS